LDIDIEKVYRRLAEKINVDKIKRNECMAEHTSFKIGGPVDYMVLPSNEEEIRHILNVCIELGIDYYIMGNGTNLLVRDKGIRGVVIKIAENYSKFSVKDEIIKAQPGILLSSLSKIAMEHSLTGLEFASGIPGTLGGAVTMNAGAYGGEMRDIVTAVKAMDMEGNIFYFKNEELQFEYRSSIIQQKSLIVLEIEMHLKKGDYNNIRNIVCDLAKRRTTKQPIQLPSAGSTFKRPKNHFAAKLIEDAGLKGARVRGAQVSDLHAGFIVNVNNATAQDVIYLIQLVQKTVRDQFDILLDLEVKIIGED
jgi:UDP-N-acetylmuramate dehydrogenase